MVHTVVEHCPPGSGVSLIEIEAGRARRSTCIAPRARLVPVALRIVSGTANPAPSAAVAAVPGSEVAS
jgi:hypothetical protein